MADARMAAAFWLYAGGDAGCIMQLLQGEAALIFSRIRHAMAVSMSQLGSCMVGSGSLLSAAFTILSSTTCNTLTATAQQL